MTKMATMPIYGKNPSKIFYSGTSGPISTKLGMKTQVLQYVYKSLALTYFTARSALVSNAFEWRKLLKFHLKRKSCRKCAVGLNIYDSEKTNWSPGTHMPPLQGIIHVYFHNIQTSSLVKHQSINQSIKHLHL